MISHACGRLGFGTECKVYRVLIEVAPRTYLQSMTGNGDSDEFNVGFLESMNRTRKPEMEAKLQLLWLRRWCTRITAVSSRPLCYERSRTARRLILAGIQKIVKFSLNQIFIVDLGNKVGIIIKY